MKLIYPAIFIPYENKGGYSVIVPDLPGCVSQGSNLMEAIEMGIDAASGWILGELEEGNSFPSPSRSSDIPLENGQFINMLILDMDSYFEKYGSKN